MSVEGNRKLTLADITSPDQYRNQRPAIRQAMIEHKKNRRIALGPHVTLHFEDRVTMKYQVQEMMRAENLHREEDITQELAAYNPLIPDGSNLKCTMMIEYSDENQRQAALRDLVGLEHCICIQIEDHPPVPAIADEDLPRSTADKTSAVHFLRFEFSPGMITAAERGARWSVHSDHTAYQYSVNPLPDSFATALRRDFKPGQMR